MPRGRLANRPRQILPGTNNLIRSAESGFANLAAYRSPDTRFDARVWEVAWCYRNVESSRLERFYNEYPDFTVWNAKLRAQARMVRAGKVVSLVETRHS
jgi:hypothetical protein